MKVNEKLSILFLLEKSKISKDGLAPITIRLTIESTRAEISLGQKVAPEYWDQKIENVNLNTHPSPKEAKLIFQSVTKALMDIQTHYFFLNQRNDRVSADLLKRSYTGVLAKEVAEAQKPKAERTLLQVLNYKFSKFARLVKEGKRAESTLVRWKVTKGKLRAWLNFTFKKPDVPLSLLEKAHSAAFLQFLLVEEGIGKNTAMKYLKNTKELLAIAEDNKWLDKNPWTSFKTTYAQPRREYLTIHELARVHTKKLTNRLEHVRNVFLFACFTGYSFAELLNLKRNMIFLGNDGKRWIKIDRKKTGNPECLPLLPIPAEIVDRYETDPYCIANDVLLPVKSYHNYNAYLKEIQEICEIPFELTTHIARHTFATTVCLDHGVPLETVSKLLGHANVRTTQIYAKISNRNISNAMQRLEGILFNEGGDLNVGYLRELQVMKPSGMTKAI